MLESGFSTQSYGNVSYYLDLFNVTANTTDLGVIIPEVLAHYGPDKPITFLGNFANKVGKAAFSTNGLNFVGTMAVTVQIEGEDAIYAEFNDITGDAIVSVVDKLVHGDIRTASIGTIGNFATKVTGLTSETLMNELVTQVDKYIAIANLNLTTGVSIPEVIGADIGDMEINFMAGVAEIGVNVTPVAFEMLKNFMNGWAEEIKSIKLRQQVVDDITYITA